MQVRYPELRGQKSVTPADRLKAYYATHLRRRHDGAFYITDCACSGCMQEGKRIGQQFAKN